MSARAQDDQAGELSDTIKKRLDAAQSRYEALRQSYEHLLGHLERSENAMAADRPAPGSRRSV